MTFSFPETSDAPIARLHDDGSGIAVEPHDGVNVAQRLREIGRSEERVRDAQLSVILKSLSPSGTRRLTMSKFIVPSEGEFFRNTENRNHVRYLYVFSFESYRGRKLPCARKPNPRLLSKRRAGASLFLECVFFTMREEFIIKAAPGDFSMSFFVDDSVLREVYGYVYLETRGVLRLLCYDEGSAKSQEALSFVTPVTSRSLNVFSEGMSLSSEIASLASIEASSANFISGESKMPVISPSSAFSAVFP